MSVRVSGLDAIKAKLRQAKSATSGPAIAAAGTDWLNQDFLPVAKQLAPVRTGALRDSIDGVATDQSVIVSANTDYAAFVEYGTSKMPAQPYMRPALDRTANKLLDRVRKNANP